MAIYIAKYAIECVMHSIVTTLDTIIWGVTVISHPHTAKNSLYSGEEGGREGGREEVRGWVGSCGDVSCG